MAIRIRKVNGYIVALCAAKTEEKEGDVYLDQGTHHALTTKFGLDFHSMGFVDDPRADDILVAIMNEEEKQS